MSKVSTPAVWPDSRVIALYELNVVEQMTNACDTTTVSDAWDRGVAFFRIRLAPMTSRMES